jgi:hypothetical protein
MKTFIRIVAFVVLLWLTPWSVKNCWSQSGGRSTNHSVRHFLTQVPQNATRVLQGTVGLRGAFFTVDDEAFFVAPTKSHDLDPAHAIIHPTKMPINELRFTTYLSGRLSSALNSVCLDMHYNYSHNARFVQTYKNVFEALQIAKDLSKGASEEPDIIRAKIKRIGELLDDLETVTLDWTAENNKPQHSSPRLRMDGKSFTKDAAKVPNFYPAKSSVEVDEESKLGNVSIILFYLSIDSQPHAIHGDVRPAKKLILEEDH